MMNGQQFVDEPLICTLCPFRACDDCPHRQEDT